MTHPFQDKKVFLITDTDLDGVSCSIILQYYIEEYTKDYKIYQTADREFAELDWNACREADIVIFADLAPSDLEMYNKIKEYSDCFIFDHHLSARETLGDLDNYYYNGERCGGAILFDFFTQGRRTNPVVREFINLVDIRDRWIDTDPDWKMASDLSNIMYGMVDWVAYFRSRETMSEVEKFRPFVERTLYKFDKQKHFAFTENEMDIAYKARQKEKENVEQAEKTLDIRVDNSGNKYAFFKCTSKHSYVANAILKKYTYLDYVSLETTLKRNSEFKISLRSQNDWGVNKIAEAYDGGGHSDASSFHFKNEQDYLDHQSGKKHLI